MTRKLIIDGSAVYELDEECMLKKKQKEKEEEERKKANASQMRRR